MWLLYFILLLSGAEIGTAKRWFKLDRIINETDTINHESGTVEYSFTIPNPAFKR